MHAVNRLETGLQGLVRTGSSIANMEWGNRNRDLF